MKISTILMSAALVACGASAYAADNLMAGATAGSISEKNSGYDNSLYKAGWEVYKCTYEYDANEDVFTFGESVNDSENFSSIVRFENATTLSGLTYNGSAYYDNVATVRWDGGSEHTKWYVYKVNIQDTGYYDFKMLAAEWNNYNSGDALIKDGTDQSFVTPCGIRVIAAAKPGAEYVEYKAYEEVSDEEWGKFADYPTEEVSKFFEMTANGGGGAELLDCQAILAIKSVGDYYIELVGSHGMYVAGGFELTLNTKYDFPPADESAVNEISANANVVESSFYGLDGVKVVNPTKGSLVIERSILDNGQVKVSKHIAR